MASRYPCLKGPLLAALVLLPWSLQAAGIQVGEIQTLGDDWAGVSLDFRVQDPVIIAGPPTHVGDHPGVLRLRKVSPDGFEAKFQEWQYRRKQYDDTSHKDERVSYMAMERGRRQMPDGSVWLADTFEVEGATSWTSVAFPESFEGRPHLFLTMQTTQGTQPAAVRARDVTADGFEAAMFEEEANNESHVQETIGYIAVYSETSQGQVSLEQGAENYRLRRTEISDEGEDLGPVRIHLEEESSVSDETSHKLELVDTVIIGKNPPQAILAQQVSSRGDDTTALRMSLQTTTAAAAGRGWYLGDDVSLTESSAGGGGWRSRRLDLVREPMTALIIGENGNRPCRVTVVGVDGKKAETRCDVGPADGRKTRRVDLKGSAVRRLNVCANGTTPLPGVVRGRVKGVRLIGNRIKDDGSFGAVDAWDLYTLANCRDADFDHKNWANCGDGQVASGVVASFEMRGAGKQDLRGFRLICREVRSN